MYTPLPVTWFAWSKSKQCDLICEDEDRTSIKLSDVPNTKVKSVGKHECFPTLTTHKNR